MKLITVFIVALTIALAHAFTVVPSSRTVSSTFSRQASVVSATKAAKSKEEDLEMTLKVIQSFGGGEEAPVAEAPAEEEAEAPKKEKAAKKGKKKASKDD